MDDYNEPDWKATPKRNVFLLEIVKNGVSIEKISLDKSMITIGRLPTCDIQLEHQSISRVHAILQHDTHGEWHIFDKSVHGTVLNKNPVKSREFVRVPLSSFLQFGASTRTFILQTSSPLVADVIAAQKANSAKVKDGLSRESSDLNIDEAGDEDAEYAEYLERKRKFEFSDDEDNDETFYDKTAAPFADKSVVEDVLNHETLQRRKTELQKIIDELESKLAEKHKETFTKDSDQNGDDDDDALDAFMSNLGQKLSQETKESLLSQLKIAKDELASLEKHD